MTTSTATLTDFLLARIAEDEAAARAATPGPWEHDPSKEWHTDVAMLRRARAGSFTDDGEEFVRGRGGCVAVTGPSDDAQSMADASHIAHNDPVRVLAECGAKRRIVELHKAWPILVETPPTFEPVDNGDPASFVMRASQQIQWLTEQEYRAKFGDEPPAAPMLRALAAIYANHEDYRDEWRP